MEKISLPIKTKIATWWMVVTGGIFIIIGLFILITLLLFQDFFERFWELEFNLIRLLVVFPTPSIFFSSIFLLQKKIRNYPILILIPRKTKNLWIFLTILLFVHIVGRLFIAVLIPLESPFFIPLAVSILIYSSSLVFLLLDRKNFWKIAT